MILFIIKLISSIRKTIAGRRHPSQLAWGLALGVLLGLIPHGNLLTVALVLVVLTLQVNHAIVALVGIGLTFIAPKLDPQFDAVGRWFFNQPQVAETMAKAWQMPLVPWTDLNNTVVMGSFLIGLVSLLPIVMLTYPVLRRWALAGEAAREEIAPQKSAKAKTQDIESSDHELRADKPHSPLRRHHSANVDHPSTVAESEHRKSDDAPLMGQSGRVYDVRRIEPSEPVTVPIPKSTEGVSTHAASSNAFSASRRPTMVAIADPAQTTSGGSGQPSSSRTSSAQVREEPIATKISKIKVEADTTSADDQQKIDEALTYLLRQLRDSKDKDAA